MSNIVVEKLYRVKRNCINFKKKYFSIEHPYTCYLPDKKILSLWYEKRIGGELNWKNPSTFNEKVNWLKLHDKKKIYTTMADKYASREFISENFGDRYLVPLIGAWDSADDIDFDKLPDKFVMKCNHDCGILVCRDKDSLDIEQVKKDFTARLKRDYYRKEREWPYKNIKRKIICEEFMENTDGSELLDYKVFCFNGKAKIIEVNSGRFKSDVKEDHYDINWNHLDLKFSHYEQSGDRFDKPIFFNEMITIAEKISSNIPFLRVDFNCWNGNLYIGEMTFYHNAGFAKFEDSKWDELLGSWIELPRKKSRS